MHSTTDACAAYTTGAGAMYATTGAGAAYTAGAVATYSTGAKQQKTPLERARRIRRQALVEHKTRWYWRDVRNDGHCCRIRHT